MNTHGAAREPLLDIEVRPIDERDLAEVRNLTNDVFPYEDIWRKRAWGGLVALQGGKVAGVLVFQKYKASFHILRLVVAENLRRRGIGSRLLEALKARALEDGLTKILAEVSEENSPGQGFLAKHFTSGSVVPTLYRGNVDGYALWLKLE